jgi:hypothetical protein
MATAEKIRVGSDGWISLVHAAQMLGETRLKILTRAVKGEIEAQHIAGRTIVTRASVERLIANRQSAVA